MFNITTYSAQFSSVAQSYPTLCDPMNCNTPGLPVHQQLPEFTKLTSIESVMPSSHLILCRPLLLLPPIPPSIRVFSNESTLHMRWPKYWSFSFSIREMQIKTTMRYHFTPTRVTFIKTSTNNKRVWREGNPPTLLVGM